MPTTVTIDTTAAAARTGPGGANARSAATSTTAATAAIAASGTPAKTAKPGTSGTTAARRRAEPAHLYLALADELAGHIAAGRFRGGERVPSVRELARQRRVSAATALATLRALERRGLVEARPKSGYFVRARERPGTALRTTRPSRSPQPLGIDGRLGAVLAASLEPGTVQLGSAVPDASWFPAEALQRALARRGRRSPRLLAEYGPYMGLDVLRRAIARRYAEIGCALDPEELVVTNGCMEALGIALGAVTKPGDVVALESPAYFGFLQLLEGMGLRALELPTDARSGISLEALEGALAAPGGPRVAACLVVANFSNPLGATLPDERKRALVALCRRYRVALVEDDIYGELNHHGQRPLPLRSFDLGGHVILCSSFSKVLAPGARIGWIAPGRWATVVRLRRFMASVATPGLLQATLAEYLGDGGYARHLQKLRARCAEHVDRVADAVARHFPAGTRMSRPEGGFVLWVELPAGHETLPLWERARAERISFMPGPVFSALGRYRTCLRLNCGLAWNRRTEQALATLGRLALAH